MNKHNLVLLTSLIMFILPNVSYSDTDQAILLQCSLKQRIPFDSKNNALPIISLSKKLDIEFLFYKEKTVTFFRFANSNNWIDSLIYKNPDYYRFRHVNYREDGGFDTKFFVDRKNLTFSTDKINSVHHHDLEEYWKSLSEELKLKNYGDGGIEYFQFFGDCKIGSYSEPQI